jgi:hypothetical protein
MHAQEGLLNIQSLAIGPVDTGALIENKPLHICINAHCWTRAEIDKPQLHLC